MSAYNASVTNSRERYRLRSPPARRSSATMMRKIADSSATACAKVRNSGSSRNRRARSAASSASALMRRPFALSSLRWLRPFRALSDLDHRPHPQALQARWIESPGFDLAFFILSPLAGLALLLAYPFVGPVAAIAAA